MLSVYYGMEIPLCSPAYSVHLYVIRLLSQCKGGTS